MNIAWMITGIILLGLLVIYISINMLKVFYYPIISAKIPKCFHGYRIVQLSDLHLKQFGKHNMRLLRKIHSTQPDCIVITGDMVDKKRKTYDTVIKLLAILVEQYPVYYSLGNHELTFSCKRLKQYIQELENIGVIVLDNKNIVIEKEKQYIRLYGMNHHFGMSPKVIDDILQPKYYHMMVNLLGHPDPNEYTILIAHDALNYPLYDTWGANLVFSGHVHGGIVKIFGKGLLSPRRTLFPAYSFGKYEGKNGCMIVSNGLGNGKHKFRIFNFPSLQCVTLRSQ